MKKLGYLILVLTFFLIAGCGQKKLDLQEYFKYEVRGLDTQGQFEYTIDIDSIALDLKKIDQTITEKEISDLKEFFRSGKMITVDKKENLSNGDEVTVSLKSNDNFQEYLTGVTNKKISVSGLKEGKKLSAEKIKEAIELKVSGTDGTGKAEVIVKDEELKFLEFVVTNSGRLKNGGTAQVSVNMSRNAAEEKGYFFEKNLTVELPVAGLEKAPPPKYFVEMLNIYQQATRGADSSAGLKAASEKRDKLVSEFKEDKNLIESNYKDLERFANYKPSKLYNFMISFEYKMKQNYDRVTDSMDFKKATLNGKETQWNMMGNVTANNYSVLVVDSFVDNKNKHAYLFAFVNGEPVVLYANVSKEGMSTADYKETDNKDIKDGFKGIVN